MISITIQYQPIIHSDFVLTKNIRAGPEFIFGLAAASTSYVHPSRFKIYGPYGQLIDNIGCRHPSSISEDYIRGSIMARRLLGYEWDLIRVSDAYSGSLVPLSYLDQELDIETVHRLDQLYHRSFSSNEIYTYVPMNLMMAKDESVIIASAAATSCLNHVPAEYRTSTCRYIFNVCTDPDYRRIGVGTSVLIGLINILSSTGIDTFILEVKHANTSATQMYRRLGFQHIYTDKYRSYSGFRLQLTRD